MCREGVNAGKVAGDFKRSGTAPLHLGRCRHPPPHSRCASGAGAPGPGRSPPGQRRCTGHRPWRQAHLVCLSQAGSVQAPSACLGGGSSLLERPPRSDRGRAHSQFGHNRRYQIIINTQISAFSFQMLESKCIEPEKLQPKIGMV